MSEPIWMDVARREIGVKELMGTAHAPRILHYHAVTRLSAKSDETAWCSAFVCWVLETAGIASTRSAAAISYETWGYELDGPRVGAIVVFSRPTPSNPRSRHVGFYVGSDGDKWRILGGNQRNSVCIASYRADTVTAVRWPHEPIVTRGTARECGP